MATGNEIAAPYEGLVAASVTSSGDYNNSGPSTSLSNGGSSHTGNQGYHQLSVTSKCFLSIILNSINASRYIKFLLFCLIVVEQGSVRNSGFLKPNPYVELLIDNKSKRKTDVVKNTYFAKWNEEFTVLVSV